MRAISKRTSRRAILTSEARHTTVSWASPTGMIAFNDSDFGIEGDGNKSLRITFQEPALQ